MQIHKISVLKNGLKVLMVPSREVMSVKVEMIVKTGAEYETLATQGISHVLEHMCFKGTTKRPTPQAISREIDTLGGIYNAYTDNEVTGYWVKVDKKYLHTALDIISDMYLHPLFPEAELAKEKGVIIEEIHMYEDNPMEHVNEVFTGLMYGKNNPGGWSIAGTVASVSAVTRDKLVAYATRQYTAPNSLLVISGNFDEKQTLISLNKYFGSAPTKTTKAKNKVKKIAQTKPQAQLETKDSNQCHLVLGFPSINCFSQKKYALQVLLTILNGGMSARLFKVIREELGAAYYINAENPSYLDYGFFCINTGLNLKKVSLGLRGIISQLKEMAQGKITEEEFKNAKTNIHGKLALSLDSVYNYATWITKDAIINQPYESPEEYLSKIDKITLQDVSRLAKEIFQPTQLNLAVVSSASKAMGKIWLQDIEKAWRE